VTDASLSTETAPPPSRWRQRAKLAGVIVINLLLVAVIIGLLVATWMPAYVDRHPEIRIGESYTK
jgi:Tfp pilus assembly protein PilE